jgi:hypothetical protein
MLMFNVYSIVNVKIYSPISVDVDDAVKSALKIKVSISHIICFSEVIFCVQNSPVNIEDNAKLMLTFKVL